MPRRSRAVPAGEAVATAPGRPRASVMMDVARLAGVSHQTVSRVLNDHQNVRPQTRDRVLEAMRELNYQPNSAARSLVTRRSNTLGIVTIDSTLFGPASMVYGIEKAARAAGYFVSIASLSSVTKETVNDAVGRLMEQAVEGIVAVVPHDDAVRELAVTGQGVVTVAVGVGGGAPVPVIGVDNVAGAVMATEHLLAQGHRTVHHISGPEGYPDARERRAGWRKALTAAGAEVPSVLFGDWSARSGFEHGLALADDPAVTAVFCGNDQMALGLLRALYECGRRVPADVGVVGFDDVPEAGFMIPPLTTIRQDFAEVGRSSIDLLVQLASGERPLEPVRILLTPSFIQRDSTFPR